MCDQHSCQVLCSLDTQAIDNIAFKLCPTIWRLKNTCHEAWSHQITILNTTNVKVELYKLFFWIFCFMIFFRILEFFAFFGFYSFLYFNHCSSVFVFKSLLLFIFTNRWSTVHRTWGTVLRHVRVLSSDVLLRGELDGEVADAAEVYGAALELDHLASWGTRWGPCGLVIKASLHRAPGSISQPKLLLQENLKWSYGKVKYVDYSYILNTSNFIYHLWILNVLLFPLMNPLSQVYWGGGGSILLFILLLGHKLLGHRQILMNPIKICICNYIE